jgi:hypothetical protein
LGTHFNVKQRPNYYVLRRISERNL